MTNETKNNILSALIFIALIFVLYVPSKSMILQIRRVNMSDKEIFSEAIESREWGGFAGIGPGSTREDGAGPFLDYLQDFLDSHNDISSIIDMGCGYGELLKNIKIAENINYLGLDIVDKIIAYNQKHYVRKNLKFAAVNNIEELSAYKGDLLIIKDVLELWSLKNIMYAKNQIMPNFKYIIVVNNIWSAFTSDKNCEAQTGYSRPLDLEAAPFFMKPAFVKDYLLPPHRVKRMYLFINENFTAPTLQNQ